MVTLPLFLFLHQKRDWLLGRSRDYDKHVGGYVVRIGVEWRTVALEAVPDDTVLVRNAEMSAPARVDANKVYKDLELDKVVSSLSPVDFYLDVMLFQRLA